jgi:hypothetical protein
MAVVYLPRGSIMKWNTNKITEHNRSEFSMTPERIKYSERTANGTLREWVVATKWTFDCSWDNVPAETVRTVDNAWGGKAMDTFYKAQTDPFTLAVTMGDGTVETYTVVFDTFDKTIVSRGGTTDGWNISVSLKEV